MANEAVLSVVAPWFPDATIDKLDFSETCGCYSEWTTESPYYYLTLKAAQGPRTDQEFMTAVTQADDAVTEWARGAYSWTGCRCCCGGYDADGEPQDGYDPDDPYPSVYVRVIPTDKVED